MLYNFFFLDQPYYTKDIPRSELENFFLRYNQTDLDGLIACTRKQGETVPERKSSISGNSQSPPSSTTSSPSTPSRSRTSSTTSTTNDDTCRSVSSQSNSSSSSNKSSSRSTSRNNSFSSRSRTSSGGDPPLLLDETKSTNGTETKTGVGLLSVPEKKRGQLHNSTTGEEFNPRTATPEDYRKRAGVVRAHTWTPGAPLTPLLANRLRRRLSITHDPEKPYILDGIPDPLSPRQLLTTKKEEIKKHDAYFAHFASFSHVGLIPFNRDKVNQDRCAALAPFGSLDRGFFGVFDGHGSNGHEVAGFVAAELPKHLATELEKMKKKQEETNLPVDTKDYIGRAFYRTFELLKTKSEIDCTYSGSTAILCYIQGETLFACNVGDSRAVMAVEEDKRFIAVPLSSDQTPARDDEKRRILKCGGRVEPCLDEDGSHIGPLRVWLKHRAVPGLAMTRSFGDLVATPIGVSPVPEIYERKLEKNDSFIIIASDGVWEFISNQEAVDIVVSAGGDPQKAAELLYQEADKRWKREEEVIDDITAMVLYLNCGSLGGLPS